MQVGGEERIKEEEEWGREDRRSEEKEKRGKCDGVVRVCAARTEKGREGSERRGRKRSVEGSVEGSRKWRGRGRE